MKIITLKNVIIFGVVLRVIIFVILCFQPFPFGLNPPVSALSYQTGVDLQFYLDFIKILKYDESSLNIFVSVYESIISGNTVSTRFPGPLFPSLLWLFDYNPDNTFPLSIFILIVEIFTFVIWEIYIVKKVGLLWSIPYIIMPHQVWMGLLVSSDAIFLFLASICYLIVNSRDDSFVLKYKYRLLIPSVLLLILSRPSVIAILIYLCIFLIIDQLRERVWSKYTLLFIILLTIATTFYYIPYFMVNELYDTKPTSVELFMSSLGVDKNDSGVLYFVSKYFLQFVFIFGFSTSKSGYIIAYLIRYIFAGLFVIGFFEGLRRKNLDSLFICLTVIPVWLFSYPSWRYLIPVLPLLYIFSVEVIKRRYRLAKVVYID